MSQADPLSRQSSPEPAAGRYLRVRRATLELCRHLTTEDMVVQSMPDASPTKWHLAHTSWFFERFVLEPLQAGYRAFNPDWHLLFNSYYQSAGAMFNRPERGLLSRPGVTDIVRYRQHVDEHMGTLLAQHPADPVISARVDLGLNHEQQHQELLLTDIKHALSLNPLKPAYRNGAPTLGADAPEAVFVSCEGGIVPCGARENGFCFDNETPRHEVLLQPFQLASRLVTNGEYREFVRDGGYRRAEHWLSDGWATVQQRQWQHPLYWSPELDSEFTLLGEIELDPARPVCHVSYYEADAFARWAEARLPGEAEWESVACQQAVAGNLLDDDRLHPTPAGAAPLPAQLYGDVWEWTHSPYSAYPGFRPLQGSLGEYNGKFMCNQLVLRGGSCLTWREHLRPSYRNFFYPDARWQMSGIRLARDA